MQNNVRSIFNLSQRKIATAMSIAVFLLNGVTIAQDDRGGCVDIPADIATNLSPADGATPLISTSLYWTTGACTTSSQLYFGTSPTPSLAEYQGEQTSPWTPLKELEFSTTYYWQVVTFNEDGPDTEGPILSFTTQLTGACCAFIVDEYYCFQAQQEACEVLGDYHGDGSVCGDIDCPPPVGACCVGTVCVENSTVSQCEAFSGTFYGDGVSCSEGTCDSPPTGACCIGEVCSVINEADCVSGGGTYQGNGSSCTGDPCASTAGACCTDELCLVTSPEDCDAGGGIFLGSGTDCSGSPCALGSCCVTEVCVEVPEQQCIDFNGVFNGAGTLCADDPCSPLGACCVGE
ncbi:MAG: fibronectin type III domain-containing protein, partial [Phycisphaerae bacterium]|nr:fibronectin type III domain-containing protein [Phycisphaerae bacterium]